MLGHRNFWTNFTLLCSILFCSGSLTAQALPKQLDSQSFSYNGGEGHSNPMGTVTVSASSGTTGSGASFSYRDDFLLNINTTSRSDGARSAYDVTLRFADGVTRTFPVTYRGDLRIGPGDLPANEIGNAFTLTVDVYYEYIGSAVYLFNNSPPAHVLNETLADIGKAPWPTSENFTAQMKVYNADNEANVYDMSVLLNNMSNSVPVGNGSPYSTPSPPAVGPTLAPEVQNAPLYNFNDHSVSAANGVHYKLSFLDVRLHGDQLSYHFEYVPPNLTASSSTGTWNSAGTVSALLNGSSLVGQVVWSSVDRNTGAATTFTTQSGALPFSTLNTGDQDITFSYIDSFTGGTLRSNTVEVKVDHTAPVLSGVPIPVVTAMSGSSVAVTLSWPAAVDGQAGQPVQSGVAVYMLLCNGVQYSQVATVQPVTLSLDRTIDNMISVSVIAVDNANNVSVPITASFLLPKQIAVSGSGTVVLNHDQTMMVTVPLNVTPRQFLQNYGDLRLTPVDTAFPASLTTAPIILVPSNVVDSNGNLLDSIHWRVDGDGNLDYLYSITTLPAIGGTGLQFAVSESIAGSSLEEACGIGAQPSAPFALPSRPGSLTKFQIVDMEGNPYGSSEFQVDNSGRVQVDFQGTGLDQDTWTAEVDRVTATAVGSTTLTGYSKLGGSAFISYPYDVSASSYPDMKTPITLAIGLNNIQVVWIQAADSYQTRQYSANLSANFEKTASGYTLTISRTDSPTVQTNDSGDILASPGEQLRFSLPNSLDPGLVTWAFDDGTLVSNQLSTSHSFVQQIGQTTDSVTHQLTLTIDGTTTSVAIIVQDTEDGALYMDEVWNGPHTVTGNVLVQGSRTLTIGSMQDVSTSVTFSGGLAAGPKQGFTIQGGLIVGPTAVTFSPSAQGSRWGTILVSGGASSSAQATLTNAVIRGADRAVTAGPNSNVSLNGLTLTGNNCGIQVYGNAVARVTGCSFIDNAAYGVKEDAGGRPVMVNNLFGGNTNDYYAFGSLTTVFGGTPGGVLSLSEVNGLSPNNNGNAPVGN